VTVYETELFVPFRLTVPGGLIHDGELGSVVTTVHDSFAGKYDGLLTVQLKVSTPNVAATGFGVAATDNGGPGGVHAGTAVFGFKASVVIGALPAKMLTS
jgi:hypothetical protein